MLVKKIMVFERIQDIIAANALLPGAPVVFCWLPLSLDELDDKDKLAMACTLPLGKLMLGINRASNTGFSRQESERHIRTLTRFFFLDAYSKTADTPILALMGKGNTPALSIPPALGLFCIEQGFDGVHFIDELNSEEPAVFYSFTGQDTSLFDYDLFLKKWIAHIIQYKNPSPALLFISCSVPEDAGKALVLFNDQETEAIKKDDIYPLLLIIFDLFKDRQQEQKQLKYLEGQQIFKTQIAHFQAVESQQVLQWYLKEYEVLPLWYKRFGHIIKVFMGKRTLKSLFD